MDQIWSEAVARLNAGEPLYLPPTLETEAVQAKLHALETDEREGLIREYLDILLPENWYDLNLYDRRDYSAI